MVVPLDAGALGADGGRGVTLEEQFVEGECARCGEPLADDITFVEDLEGRLALACWDCDAKEAKGKAA